MKSDSNGKVSCSNAPTRALTELNTKIANAAASAEAVPPEEPECSITGHTLVISVNYLPAVATEAVKIIIDGFEIPEGTTTTAAFGQVYLSDSEDRLVSQLKTKASINAEVEPCERKMRISGDLRLEIEKNSTCGNHFTDEFCCVKVSVHRKLEGTMSPEQHLATNSLKPLVFQQMRAKPQPLANLKPKSKN